MTREEAIKILQELTYKHANTTYIKALDMATEALLTDAYTDAFRAMFTESAEAYKTWTGEEMGGTSERQNVSYICDKRRCDKEGCSNCGRTTDIEHAKNFELINNTYYERW